MNRKLPKRIRRLLEKRSQLFFKKLTTGDTEDELAFRKMRNRCNQLLLSMRELVSQVTFILEPASSATLVSRISLTAHCNSASPATTCPYYIFTPLHV
ncbi:hypothetical protein T265_11865 [Opisthorchis viverrini]|uniref:Uncharacterized protein n=1 Tax=Opisthorchis viverrini TaxID=6198 RepID=A0A074Z1G1_OPIVI|nr:hypothetical protein T265_11865 [Opisthorchis viverrini]KER19322.1 hypothetical protein T265_11865 [Opisthorchis viverrini]